MPWLQLKIAADRDLAPEVEAAMQKSGALSVTFEDNADQAIFEPTLGEMPLWRSTRITGLYDAKVDTKEILNLILSEYPSTQTNAHWELLEDKDWQREWMQHFSPLQCGKKFWICPSWIAPPDPESINLMLDPGLAFGTGTHPTTFMCLEWLSKQKMTNNTVIDYGCGSGILGIAALLHGANSAVGVDIDPQALVATADNARRNRLDVRRFPVFMPANCPKEVADLVFANILAGPLIELSAKLNELTKAGGTLCLSGILATQVPELVKAYESHFQISEVIEKEEWACLILKKPTRTRPI